MRHINKQRMFMWNLTVSMPCEYSDLTAWQLLRSTLSSSQSSSRSSCTPLALGGASRRPTKPTASCHLPWHPFGLCEQHHKNVQELVDETDDKLFTNIKYNKQHVLHSILPSTINREYNLRHRPRNFKLTTRHSSITDCDFITRIILKDVYWLYVFFLFILCLNIAILHVSSYFTTITML